MNNLLERIPPNNTGTEASVLSALFMDNKGFENIEELTPDDFYKGANKIIFETMLALRVKKEPIDLMTVSAELKTTGQDKIVTLQYILKIVDEAPVATNVQSYARKLMALTKAREMILIASQIVDKGFSATDVEDYISESQSKVLQVQTSLSKDQFIGMNQLMGDALDRIEKAQTSQLEIGLNFGFPKLDHFLQIWGSKLIVLAARPSVGKTSLAISIAMHLGYQGKKTGFISMEMDAESVADRMLSAESNINSMVFYAKDSISRQGINDLSQSANTLAELPISIDDAPCNIQDIERKCRKFKKDGKDLIIIDQLSHIGFEKGVRPYDGFTQNCKAITNLTKELKMPILVLSQLNRNLENRSDKRPMLSDLSETGRIEQDASIVLFLYREGLYDDNVDLSTTEIILAKNRQGSIGTERRVLFNKKRGSFRLMP